MFQKLFKPTILSINANLGVLFLRIGIGLIMIAGHGYQKLQKYLGSDLAFGDPIGLGEETSLLLAIFAEFICSLLLIFGFLTRAVLIPLIFTMLVALFVVHGNAALGKQELPLLYALSYLTLFLTGPGKYSLDQVIFRDK
ncbi:DoxX family protein [Persicitalea sp.]|uniref:DoxX family protein n=1 Tax=Persicitalea sp. TaxID=3100273 RepID=UPI0035946661